APFGYAFYRPLRPNRLAFARVTGEGQKLLIVTGASGQLARRVAERVPEVRGPKGVVLVTRSPEAIPDLAARGADVRFGDFDRPESLREAFAGRGPLLLARTTEL